MDEFFYSDKFRIYVYQCFILLFPLCHSVFPTVIPVKTGIQGFTLTLDDSPFASGNDKRENIGG